MSWTYKLEGEPSQISQQNRKHPVNLSKTVGSEKTYKSKSFTIISDMSWTYKLQGDPSQVSEQTLNQPIETDKPNHIGGFHRARTSEAIGQRQGNTIGMPTDTN